jgi:hypothetical protein
MLSLAIFLASFRELRSQKKPAMKKIFWFFGFFNTANGLWMLFAPRA